MQNAKTGKNVSVENIFRNFVGAFIIILSSFLKNLSDFSGSCDFIAMQARPLLQVRSELQGGM